MLTPACLLSASLGRQPVCCLGNTSSTAARCGAWARGCSTLPTGSCPHGTFLCRTATRAGGPLPWAKSGGGFAHHLAGQQELLWQSHQGMQRSHGDPTARHGCRWPWRMLWAMVDLHSQQRWEGVGFAVGEGQRGPSGLVLPVNQAVRSFLRSLLLEVRCPVMLSVSTPTFAGEKKKLENLV